LDTSTTLAVAATGLAIGLLIGSTAIGGVLLAPALVFLTGMDAHQAVALALWCFLWSGPVAVHGFVRRGSVQWRGAAWLCAAAAPAALAGTLVAAHVPTLALQAMIGAVTAGAGANVLRPAPEAGVARGLPGAPALLLLGALSGFLSALLGAGGALILTPILIALRVPVLQAIGLGQAIQIPISAVASIEHLRGGDIDLHIGLWLPPALVLGIACGVPLAHALPQQRLKRLLGWVMLAAGAMILVRTV